MQWINHYALDNAISFRNTHPLNSARYPAFEQPGPGIHRNVKSK